MGYVRKKEYQAAARTFIEKHKKTAHIYGKMEFQQRGTNATNNQSKGKTGQIIDFYKGTSLNGFINVKKVQ